MEQAFAGFQKGLDAVINTALKQFQDAQSQARRHAVPAIFGQGGEGDPKGKTFGDWLVNVAILTTGKGDRTVAAKRLDEVYASSFAPWQKAAMGESCGVTGGYVVPPEFYEQLMQVVAEQTFFRKRAFVQPMAARPCCSPISTSPRSRAAGISPFFGGVMPTGPRRPRPARRRSRSSR